MKHCRLKYDTALITSIASLEQVQSNITGDNMTSDKFVLSKGGVRHVQAYIYLPGIITHDEQLEGIILKGIGPDFDWANINQYNDSGGYWNAMAKDELIISRITANRLQLKEGDKLIVYFIREGTPIQRRFVIKGIYRTGLEENDAKFALASIDMVRGVLQWDSTEVSGLEIAVDNIDDIPLITDYIYQDELPGTLYAESIREKFPSLFEWLQLQDINTVVIIALMLAVAIINMITALLILILERTQMIGS
jgi:lipoprotein-releasing system permease protein